MEFLPILESYFQNVDLLEQSFEGNQETARHLDYLRYYDEGLFKEAHGTRLEEYREVEALFATLYETQGRYDEAEQLYTLALTKTEKIRGPKHRETLRMVAS